MGGSTLRAGEPALRARVRHRLVAAPSAPAEDDLAAVGAGEMGGALAREGHAAAAATPVGNCHRRSTGLLLGSAAPAAAHRGAPYKDGPDEGERTGEIPVRVVRTAAGDVERD